MDRCGQAQLSRFVRICKLFDFFLCVFFADTELISVLHETWVESFSLLATLLWKSGQITFPSVTTALANHCTAIIGNDYSWMFYFLATNKQIENRVIPL